MGQKIRKASEHFAMPRLGLTIAALLLASCRSQPSEEPTCDATGKCSGAGAPHGGSLVSTVVTDAALKKQLIAETSATLVLSERQACDVALLIFGGFSPLDGFMKKADYDGVVENMRLTNGVLFSLPVVLDVADTSLQ